MATDPVTSTSTPARIPLPVTSSAPSDELRTKLGLFDPGLKFKTTATIPSLWYYDPEIYEIERQAVFGQNWVLVGRADQAPTPRSYFTVEVAEEPVVVLRDDDNQLRAFSNLCRHRATQLLTKPEGVLSDDNIRCDYHRWCYEARTGNICGAPELGKVKDIFPLKNLNLPQFELATWGPLVFVRMEQGANATPLTDIIAPIIDRTKDIDFSKLKWAGRREYEIACNWKSYVGNFLDGGGHVPSIHPELAGSLNFPEYSTEIFDKCSLQQCPTLEKDDKTRQGTAMYWWAYPNTMINIYDGVMDTNIVLPMGPDRCKVIFDFYFDDKWDKQAIDKYIERAHQVQLEDMGVCERQRLKSRFYKFGPYANRETGEHHFHQLLAQDLQRAIS